MYKSKFKSLLQFLSVFTVVLMIASILTLPQPKNLSASAISTDYPAQLVNISTLDNKKNLSISGTGDNSALNLISADGTMNENWRFDYVGTDSKGSFFKIINQGSGRLLTPKGYSVKENQDVVIYGSESAKSQHWYISAVQNDKLGNGLYYKIVNYSDTNLALTNSSGSLSLKTYSGADSQKWLLNSSGLQGFAGYCSNDNNGNIKAGDIGGLLGATVEVNNFNDLKKYATSDTPYTIVVTGDISVTNLQKDSQNHYYCPDGRIYVHSNKTIIGSYSKHTLNNVQFCTATKNGVGNNVIIKNFDLQHDYKSNGNDSIVVYFGSGKNLWVDHVTFTGHKDYNMLGYDTCPDWDKFLACCYDADYCTVSDCSFGLHEYGLILGYPDDTADVKNKYDNYPHMTLASNKFYQTLTRGPGLMRWGYFHSLNNYVNKFSMAYTVHSGCDIYAENCFYENGGNVICDWNKITYAGAYAEKGSKFSNCNRTVRGQGTANNPSYSIASSWNPAGNYAYKSISADQAKSYCSTYSGCQSGADKMNYLTLKSAGVPSAGYVEVPGGESSDPSTPTAAKFSEGATFMFKNVNSGLYMEVANGSAENGTNVQQWGADGSAAHNTWKLYSAGNGYYYIASCVGDGGTYVLDVEGKKSTNGTNVDIYKFNSGTNQQFMLTENADGSYKIRPRVADGNSAVEIAAASKQSGANVQQWEVNGVNCQDWILEPVADIGTKMDTNVIYTFENANSGLVMDIVNGSMTEGTNVQQWGSNGFGCQKWVLKEFGSGNYYWIRSLQNEDLVLKAEGSGNGSNIDIVNYSSKDSSQLFRFTKNIDGTYSILTHASKESCLVEVDGASKESGANVQQYAPTNSPCQKWNAVTETRTTTTVTTTATTTTTTTTTTVPLKGDFNDDGHVASADLVLMQKYLLGIEDFTEEQFNVADINGDGIADVFDYIELREIVSISSWDF